MATLLDYRTGEPVIETPHLSLAKEFKSQNTKVAQAIIEKPVFFGHTLMHTILDRDTDYYDLQWFTHLNFNNDMDHYRGEFDKLMEAVYEKDRTKCLRLFDLLSNSCNQLMAAQLATKWFYKFAADNFYDGVHFMLDTYTEDRSRVLDSVDLGRALDATIAINAVECVQLLVQRGAKLDASLKNLGLRLYQAYNMFKDTDTNTLLQLYGSVDMTPDIKMYLQNKNVPLNDMGYIR